MLRTKAGVFEGALSATIAGGSGKDVFPTGQVPTFAPAVEAFGTPPGVTTKKPQPTAFLRFADQQGAVVLEIKDLLWVARQGSDCTQMSVDVYATVPPTEYGKLLHLSSGSSSIGTLAEVSDAGASDAGCADDDSGVVALDGGCHPTPPTSVGLHFTFQGVPVLFDYGTL